MPTVYPYTVTNSYKGGFFMRTYGRNVRRAWDGDDYRAPKRQRLDHSFRSNAYTFGDGTNENASHFGDLEDNLERAIRETSVAALSSSPSRRNSTVFSTHDHDDHGVVTTLTPPSSPPAALHVTPPNIKQRKPTFSFMDKKKKEKEKLKAMKRKLDGAPSIPPATSNREGSEPLSEILNSSSRAVNQPADAYTTPQPVPEPPAPAKPTLQKAMTQTVLDFGQSLTPVTCAHCQMSYTPSVPEDAQLHQMYHNRHQEGIELGKAFTKAAMKWCYEVPHIPGSVVVVDRKISIPGRRVVQRVLEVVNRELGSVDIPEADLWSQKSLDDEHSGDESVKKVDRYKAFLHVIEGKCVGVCLAERIAKAYRVTNASQQTRTPAASPDKDKDKAQVEVEEDGATSMPTPASTSLTLDVNGSPSASASSADLVLETTVSNAVVGVSRIWTSNAYRRKGIAMNLLECVASQFIYGLEIDREDMAFSQPTELGVGLARGWYGDKVGWRVYHET